MQKMFGSNLNNLWLLALYSFAESINLNGVNTVALFALFLRSVFVMN